jgi:NDP-sugar pyrophosphorylase family protein
MFPAVIFAAGFGTRMQELTVDTPKPLLSFNGSASITQLGTQEVARPPQFP